MAVHTNYKTVKTPHSNSYSNYKNHNNYTSYRNHSNYTEWHNGGTWGDAPAWVGYWQYGAHKNSGSSYGQHTNKGANNNYYNQAATTYNYVQSVNRQPQVTGTPSPGSGNMIGTNVTINVSSLTYSDSESNAWNKWRAYYRYSKDGGTYGNLTLIAEVAATSKTYSWNVINMAAGYYYIYITVFDGNTWSALPNGTEFVTHHIQNSDPTGLGSADYSYDTIKYAASQPLKLIKYSAPSWIINNPYITAEEGAQLQSEINKARKAFGLNNYTFSTTIVVDHFDIIKKSTLDEMRTAANDVYKIAKNGSSFNFTSTTNIQHKNLDELRSLLESLSK